MSWEDIGRALAAILDLYHSPLPATLDTHDAGRRIVAKYGFSFYERRTANTDSVTVNVAGARY